MGELSQSVHINDKMFAPNCSLHLVAIMPPKKFAPSPRLHPQSDHIIHTHTKQVKTLTYGFVLGSLHRPQLTFDLKNSNLDICRLSRKIRHTTEAQLTPYKTRYAFSHSPLGQGVTSTNLLPVRDPRMEPSYTHSH